MSTTLYVREQGALVRKDHYQVVVTLGKEELHRAPIANLEQLVLMGNVQMTTPAAVMLMREGIDIVFMGMHGGFRGRAQYSGSKLARIRLMQLRLCDDMHRSLDIARAVVIGKITNQRVVLQRRAQGDPEVQSLLSSMLDMSRAAAGANNIDQLRGYEGKAAAYYFEAFRRMMNPDWGFKGREYHPPPDPFNALLSFTYTMLLKDVEAKIQLVGLDPYLGFFHALGYDRPGLALDMMEEFRPSIADSVVLNLLSREQITLDDFDHTNNPNAPVRMRKDAIQDLVAAYEQRMATKVFHPLANGETNYRRAVELQVRQMTHLIVGETDRYQPLTMK